MGNINKNRFKNFTSFLMIQMRDSVKLYITSVMVLLIFLSIMSYGVYSEDSFYLNEAYNSTFILILNLSAFIVSSSSFSILNKYEKRIQLFTLPVSMLSRLVSTLIVGVFIPIALILLFHFVITNSIIELIASQGHMKPFLYLPFHDSTNEMFSKHELLKQIYITIVFQSAVLMTGSVFQKISNAKTVILALIVFFTFIGLDYMLSAYLYDENFVFLFFYLIFLDTPSSTNLSNLVPFISCYWYAILYFLILPVSWYVVYLRYKETEG